jgi:uncharacterized protein YbbK (DUF523 family)
MVKIVVSSCLLGAPVRHDGRDKKSDHPILERWLHEGRVVTACPEMLGGLGTPRPPAEIVRRDGARHVITREGRDVTVAFENGAEQVARQAREEGVRIAVLKSGSPSCGTSFVYDGTFTKTPVPGAGITTELLRERGIAVFSEEELEAADQYLSSLEAAG